MGCPKNCCAITWGTIGGIIFVCLCVVACVFGFCAETSFYEDQVADHLDLMFENGGKGNILVAYAKVAIQQAFGVLKAVQQH